MRGFGCVWGSMGLIDEAAVDCVPNEFVPDAASALALCEAETSFVLIGGNSCAVSSFADIESPLPLPFESALAGVVGVGAEGRTESMRNVTEGPACCGTVACAVTASAPTAAKCVTFSGSCA